MSADTLSIPFDNTSFHVAIRKFRRYVDGVPLAVLGSELSSGVLELMRNVNEWSHSTGLLKSFFDQQHLIVAVDDEGVGLFHNLQHLPGIFTATKAVQEAFQVGVTTSGNPLRGHGLSYCLDLTSDGGNLFLDTVGASATGWGGKIQTVSASNKKKGTSAVLRFPTTSL